MHLNIAETMLKLTHFIKIITNFVFFNTDDSFIVGDTIHIEVVLNSTIPAEFVVDAIRLMLQPESSSSSSSSTSDTQPLTISADHCE